MSTRTARTMALTMFLTALFSGLPPAAFAAHPSTNARGALSNVEGQTRQPAPPRAEVAVPQPMPARFADDQNARETRQRLREIMDQYPPSVGQVLRLDPSLLARPDYLAPYPTLVAFIQAHPEITHNPIFFFGEARFDSPENDKARAMRMAEDILAGLAGLTVFACVITFLAWLLRSIIDYRYWLRASKVQNEAHTKVFDRLTTNEDLMTYIQSPAGQRYLTSASSVDIAPRSVAAPVNRILWSVQAGVVLALAGVGLWFARSNVIDEVAQLLQVVSTLAVSLGVGFVLSALVSYALSSRLGLLGTPPRSNHA